MSYNKIPRVRLISIGTGGSPRINNYSKGKKTLEWPMKNWWGMASHVSMNLASTYSVHSSYEISENYLRMDVKSYIPMDDATQA
jgi:hypothetical protein